MAFPQDLNNVAVFKLHPAIGIARIANNDDYYEFFAQQALPKDQQKYMSKVGGVSTMKRQAVQFKIFAYDSNLQELGELTETIQNTLGLQATWSATIGNRKLHNYAKKKGQNILSINATGTASGDDVKDLIGKNPWDQNQNVTLGSITGKGLFIPGHGGVIRKTPGSKIDPYPANQSGNLETSDTTSDGVIDVKIQGTPLPVIPACIVCAPQEHSPDVNASNPALTAIGPDFRTPNQGPGNNLDWTTEMQNVLGIAGNPPVAKGTKMDAAIIATTNGEYNPGMETSFQDSRIEFPVSEIPKLFYPRGQGHIGQNEIRPKYKSAAAATGAEPGQLTSGLCSTWQGDLAACLEYWTAEFPQQVLVNGQAKFLFRKDFNVNVKMGAPEDINDHADHMGVARDESTDPNKIKYVETERQ